VQYNKAYFKKEDSMFDPLHDLKQELTGVRAKRRVLEGVACDMGKAIGFMTGGEVHVGPAKQVIEAHVLGKPLIPIEASAMATYRREANYRLN
jgi:hypothetical protein